MGVAEKALLVSAATMVAAILTAMFEKFMRADRSKSLVMEFRGDAPSMTNRDRWLYPTGLAAAWVAVILAAIVIPFGPEIVGENLGIGVFYFIVVIDFFVLGVALAGWGSNIGDTVEAFYRIVAQLISYIVPLGMGVVGVIMMAKSLSTVAIVESQVHMWFVVLQPLGFALYVVSAMMQCYQRPFHAPFSLSINQGIFGVTNRWVRVLWRLALAGLFFVIAAMGAVLFLGGWLGPWLPAPVWMLLKTFALMALILWLGHKVRPLTVAQMLALSWKVLVPVGLVNVLIVGILVLFKIGPT